MRARAERWTVACRRASVFRSYFDPFGNGARSSRHEPPCLQLQYSHFHILSGYESGGGSSLGQAAPRWKAINSTKKGTRNRVMKPGDHLSRTTGVGHYLINGNQSQEK